MAEGTPSVSTITNPQVTETSTQHHHHKHLHKLIHPLTGKIFHIVHFPHEVEARRHAILREETTKAPTDFDILIHGTDEHVNTVRDIHKHHETKKSKLLEQNSDVLTRYEHIRSELEHLSRELHLLTDHTVALDASFDKFGYSARLRTKGASDEDSERSSLNSDHASSRRNDDRSLQAIKFWRQPTIRQYYHKGLIWRSPNANEVASFELFIDLVYVAVIDTIGEAAVSGASAESFLHYVIVFSISWKVWSDMMVIINWFEIDDIFGRLSVLFILICLYSFTTNVAYFFEVTYTVGVSFYLASRFFTAIWFVFVAALTPMIRPTLIYHAIVAVVAAALWIGSIHLEYPRNLGLIFVAIIIDLYGSSVVMPIIRLLEMKFPNLNWARSMVQYLPAINIEHRVERTGAFISLVFGYSVITILFQSRAEFPLHSFLGKGILALIQAFTFNWIYFEIDAWGIHVHAIRRHFFSTVVWTCAHLPFAAGFILAASTLSELVIAHDVPDSTTEWLGEDYAARSREEVEQPLRWFYCGGLGVALISMTIISTTHIHKTLPSPRLRKLPRLLIRLCIAITIICLPLSHLNSLNLIGTTTALTILILLLDLFGNSCSGDVFWSGGFCKERKRATTYEANCMVSKQVRGRLVRKGELGEKVTLEDVLRSNDSEGNLEDGGGGGGLGKNKSRGRVGGIDQGAGGY